MARPPLTKLALAALEVLDTGAEVVLELEEATFVEVVVGALVTTAMEVVVTSPFVLVGTEMVELEKEPELVMIFVKVAEVDAVEVEVVVLVAVLVKEGPVESLIVVVAPPDEELAELEADAPPAAWTWKKWDSSI